MPRTLRDYPHLEPLFRSIKHGCAVIIVSQAETPQVFGRHPKWPDKPHIWLIGDDYDECWGPTRFDAASLQAMFKTVRTLGVMVAEPQIADYAAVITPSVIVGTDSCIIECRSEHEADWINYAKEYMPRGNAILVRTVRPEGSA